MGGAGLAEFCLCESVKREAKFEIRFTKYKIRIYRKE